MTVICHWCKNTFTNIETINCPVCDDDTHTQDIS
jgi:RNA polymerase subunit RPABC4/transcription elongation factor Spt4